MSGISDITVRNAIIISAEISADDHGCLCGWLTLDYGGEGQGFGGTVLYLPKSFKHHNINGPAGHWIWRVMEIAGVEHWSQLSGKTIRARCDWNHVHAIGHVIKDDWFCPADDFAKVSA